MHPKEINGTDPDDWSAKIEGAILKVFFKGKDHLYVNVDKLSSEAGIVFKAPQENIIVVWGGPGEAIRVELCGKDLEHIYNIPVQAPASSWLTFCNDGGRQMQLSGDYTDEMVMLALKSLLPV